MSTSIGSVTTKPKDNPPITNEPPKPTLKAAKEKPPAIDHNAQPTGASPIDVKAFYDKRIESTVSAGCAKAVADGKSPAEMAGACTEGAAWGEAAGEEIKDLVKKAPVPVVRHRVGKAIGDAVQELAKDAAHNQGVADCKVVADPAAFAKNHSSVEVANQSKAPPPPPKPPVTNFTPNAPAPVVCK